MRFTTHLSAAVALLGALAAATAVSALAAAPAPIVKLSSNGLGRILVDSRGHTLYLFEQDTTTKSTCNGQCASFWPPLRTSGKPRAGSGVAAGMLGVTRRSDGTMQATYHGHPLYAFAQDSKPGQTAGEGVDAFGAKWYVVSAAGTKIVKKAPAQSGYGSGYGK